MKLDKCLNMAVIPRISTLVDRVYEFLQCVQIRN